MPCVNGSRIVVITQGPRETILAGQRLGIVKYKVLPIDQKLVVDTTGAGDAFCGGFISSLLESSKLKNRNDSHLLVKSSLAGIHAPLGQGWSLILVHSGFDAFAVRGLKFHTASSGAWISGCQVGVDTPSHILRTVRLSLEHGSCVCF